MATMIEPPTPLPPKAERRVFLAGSIEMGKAEDWQARVGAALADVPGLLVLNPRRREWDASWRQAIDEPKFRGQVEWELDGLDSADLIAFYFAPDTKAPISLLELGLYARAGRAIVCCPEGYWRKGNVDIVCARHGVDQVADLDALVARLRDRLAQC